MCVFACVLWGKACVYVCIDGKEGRETKYAKMCYICECFRIFSSTK